MPRQQVFRFSILSIAIVIAVVLISDSSPSADQLPTAVASPFRPETMLSDREAMQLMTTLTNTTDPGEAITAFRTARSFLIHRPCPRGHAGHGGQERE